jgi:hypothetical protein
MRKEAAAKERRRGGHSDAAPLPEMLGRTRRTQAGVIIRTDSQRNVSRDNRVGWAISAAKLPIRFWAPAAPAFDRARRYAEVIRQGL